MFLSLNLQETTASARMLADCHLVHLVEFLFAPPYFRPKGNNRVQDGTGFETTKKSLSFAGEIGTCVDEKRKTFRCKRLMTKLSNI